jgi:uncharacterized protein (UPF0276 family)
LAGHVESGNWIIDTHDQSVREEVWELYSQVWAKAGCPATLLEIDDEASLSFEEMCSEALKAKKFQKKSLNDYSCITS